jgi:hypothetical protein
VTLLNKNSRIIRSARKNLEREQQHRDEEKSIQHTRLQPARRKFVSGRKLPRSGITFSSRIDLKL